MLAETALRQRDQELAYALSARGLSLGGSLTARFLLLRARSLPPWERERFEDCLEASWVMARRVRDMDLVHDIVESGRLSPRSRGGFTVEANVLDPVAPPMTQEEIDQVLAREQAEQELPVPPAFKPIEEEEACQCPVCRRKRPSSRRGYGQYELFDDLSEDDGIGFEEGIDLEDFDDLERFDDLEDLANLEDIDGFAPDLDGLELPPGLEEMPLDALLPLLEILEKYGSRKGGLPDLDEVRKRDPKLYSRLDKAFRRMEQEELLGPSPTRKKRRRKKKH
jgi:hypothetical protein